MSFQWGKGEGEDCDQIVVQSGPTLVVENTTLTTVVGLVTPCSGEEFSD